MRYNVYNVSKIAFHKDKIKSLSKGEVTAPICVRIKPTNKCDHQCFYCAYILGNDCPVSETFNPKDEIPRDKMLEIIRDFKEMGVKSIVFSGGGEPLIYPYIVEVFKKIIEYGIDFGVITNGQKLRGEKAELLKNAKWVRISSGEINPKTFAETRKRPETWFYELQENIKNFAKIKGPNCELGINFVVQAKNANQVYESAKYFKSIGVNHVKFTPVYRQSDFLEYHKPIKQLVIDQIERARKELEDDNFFIYDTYKSDFESGGLEKRNYPKCYTMQIIPVIGADSVVYFCHDKAYMKSGILGSIKNRSFKDLWFSKEAKRIFDNFDHKKGCKHHCTYDFKNILVENLKKNPEKLDEHVPKNDKHKNFM